jgi:hypothetical protein
MTPVCHSHSSTSMALVHESKGCLAITACPDPAAVVSNPSLSQSTGLVLTNLCEANLSWAAKNPTVTKFHAAVAPTISIIDYLARIRQFSMCSEACFVLALVYLDRYQAIVDLPITTMNAHRLTISAVRIASKMVDDYHENNGVYARIGGLSLSEMNELECELLFTLGFSLDVKQELYDKYDSTLKGYERV